MIDTDPRFHLEALRWYAALDRLVGVAPQDQIVHVVGDLETPVLSYLRDRGVTVVGVERFDERSPHCNKISGALSLAERGVQGIAVLTDADFVILEDARGLPVPPKAMGFRAAGSGNPPLRVLEKVFAAAGLPVPERVPLEFATRPGLMTLAGHANGGLYLVPGAELPALARRWAHWALWLLDNTELLETWAKFVDQAAMTLALAEVGLAPYTLGIRWNLPSQNPKRIPVPAPVPAAIHYHRHATADGPLLPSGSETVDVKIALVNQAIDQVWREAFPDGSAQAD